MTTEILCSYIGKTVVIKTINDEIACGPVYASDTPELYYFIIVADRGKGHGWYMSAEYVVSIEEWNETAYWDRIYKEG